MRSFASGVRFVVCLLMISGTFALTGCGGGGGGSEATAGVQAPTVPGDTAPPVSNPSTAPANKAPTISGKPAATATVGQTYSFTPTASDPDPSDKLTFTIANKPAWAAFDTTTGALTGTPTDKDVGATAPIEIAATDGIAVTALPNFTITVMNAAASSGGKSVSLAWTPPTQNADGSALTDLKGYKIHYGTESQNYTENVAIDNPGLTRYTLDSLPAGTLYIAMTAYNAAGAESPFSQEVTVKLN
jgi:hypothetical protein